jgi:hypothetical protein
LLGYHCQRAALRQGEPAVKAMRISQ